MSQRWIREKLLVAVVCVGGLGCVPRERPTGSDPVLSKVFVDEFERSQLGPNWRALASGWKIESGALCGRGAKNHPVWLRRRLPLNAVVEFEATSQSPEGDIKAEFWGDGRSAAKGVSYSDATSYLAVFGGWNNKLHVLARLDEHGGDRLEIKLKANSAEFIKRTVVPNKKYQFRFERRDGKTVRWFVDNHEVLRMLDSAPLSGTGHEHFGFNDWLVHVCFDHLKVTPLPD